MSQKDYDMVPRWYVVHTYSGYENKVKKDLENTIKNRELEEYFFDIIVPMEEQIEIKEGKRKVILKKSFSRLCINKNDCNRTILVYRKKYKRCYRVCWFRYKIQYL